MAVLLLLQFVLTVVLGIARFIVQTVFHMPRMNLLYLLVLVYLFWCIYYATSRLLSSIEEILLPSDPNNADWRTAAGYFAIGYLILKLAA